MMIDNPFSNISIAQLKRAITIREQIEELEAELSQVLSGASDRPTPHRGRAGRVAARAPRRAYAASSGSTNRSQEKPGAANGRKRKRDLSDAGRARISAAARERWIRFRAAKKAKG